MTKEVGKKYDIFISYRRSDGAQYARILQLELEKRGFSTFLDYEELVDGVFGEEIKSAIQSAPVFIMVLTPKYLERCMEEGSWVGKEIMLAHSCGSHFIPVNPDGLFDGVPENTPDTIREIVSKHQHSEINFGQLLGESIDKMVSRRISPGRRRKRVFREFVLGLLAVLVLAGVGTALFVRRHAIRELMVAKSPAGLYYNWKPGITLSQIRAVHHIMDGMIRIEGGTFMKGPDIGEDGQFADDVDEYTETPPHEVSVSTFWISKYEVSEGEWHGVMGGRIPKEKADYPVSGISFKECLEFCDRLFDLSGIRFRLPSEAEWEFAARGGNRHETTRFIGSDDPDEVSWYRSNRTGGMSHIRNDPRGGLRCNALDLYDMGGNVYEWCDTPFRLYRDIVSGTPDPEIIDPEAMVIRGGSYASDLYEITATHRERMNAEAKDETVGFRIAL
jgi:formylglycine-generating enzyme required for sulfatase activity